MIKIRKSAERGHSNLGWLDSRFTFSFADYHDPDHHHFRSLRVINEDWIEPGQGFGMHPHRDMEIITYVMQGRLEHKDSMGNGSVICAGDLQRMSAGTGVLHSEFNPSPTEKTHLLQIWIFPDRKNQVPGYEQKPFSEDAKRDNFCLIASADGRKDSLSVHQNVSIHACLLSFGRDLKYALAKNRYGWVQVIRGQLELNEANLVAGDGASISDIHELSFRAKEETEFLFFDLG